MLSIAFALVTLISAGDENLKPCSAEIRVVEGAPSLFINGRLNSGFAYLMAVGDPAKNYKQMADAGVRVFTLSAGIGNTPNGFDPSGLDASFQDVLTQCPEAMMFPRVDVSAPGWWEALHPEEMVCNKKDGPLTGRQSFFSELWLNDACRWIQDYTRYLRESAIRDHVFGIHICTGYTGEWQSWGLWDGNFGDVSAPALRAWRAYLDRKYGDDTAMAKAWGMDPSPDLWLRPTNYERRATASPLLRSLPDFQDVADYYDFYWRGTANAIQQLAAAAKRGAGRDFLVGYFYGYSIQYGGKMQESQHLGMADVMNCPDIDFFCSPAMYSNRAPGGSSTFMSFTESINRRGKFWWDEADNRTHLAHDPVAPAADLRESLNVLEREFAHTVSRNAAVWWFDMQGVWYDAPEILGLMREMRAFSETHKSRWNPPHEVAVFVDDKSSYRMPPEVPFLNDTVTNLLAYMPELGAPCDTYVLDDITTAPAYKLYIFPPCPDLTQAEREAILRLRATGAALVFMGPAGVAQYNPERNEVAPVANGQSALMGFEATGAEWQVQSKVAWVGDRRPTVDELRAIAKAAGVHIYSDSGDTFYAGNGIVSLHAKEAGEKIIRLPGEVSTREVFASDTPLECEGTEIRATMLAKETRTFTVTPK